MGHRPAVAAAVPDAGERRVGAGGGRGVDLLAAYFTVGQWGFVQFAEPSERVFPAPVLWAFPPVYLVHLLDERFWGVGTANWATAHGPLYFTNYAWLWVNIPSMLALALVVVLVARGAVAEWAVVSLGVHLLLHAVMRIGGTLVFASVSPGLISGVLLCLPLGVWSMARGYRQLSNPALRAGVIAGILSFQPLWHAVLYPFLPTAPPTA